MRRNSFILLGLAVVLVLSVTLSASAAPDLAKPRTLSLLEVDRTFMPLGDFEFDRAPVGGDQFAEANALYRWTSAKTKGARVGRNRVLVTFVTGYGTNLGHRATLFVNAQLYLPDGTLSVEGFADVPPRGAHRFTFPVIGGTGVYANARGYISVKDVGDGTTGRSRIDLVLLP
jgi:hypothetical protein